MKAKIIGILLVMALYIFGGTVSAVTEACVNDTGLDLLICEIVNNIWTIAVLLLVIAVLLIIVKAFSSRNLT